MGLLYTKMKIFHYKEKIDSLPYKIPDILPPVQVRIKPINRCNHNCSYCAYRRDTLQLGKDMVKRDYIPEDKMREIIEDLISMEVKSVTFSGGGDPFIYPFFLNTLKKLSKSSVAFASLTNGSNLEGEVAEIFSHHGKWLRISIDGWNDESYSSYRGVKHGEFSKVMNNMEKFKKLGGGCYLGVSLIVDKRNASHVYSFTKRLKASGVDSVKISPCIVSNEGLKNNDYHRTIYEEVKNQAKKAAATLSDRNFEVYDSYHEMDEKFIKEYSWCPYVQILPVIGADLNIYSCQDKAYNLDEGLIGTIKDQRFKDFWFGDKDKFFKIDPSKDCNNHCVANAKNKLVFEYLDADPAHIGFV